MNRWPFIKFVEDFLCQTFMLYAIQKLMPYTLTILHSHKSNAKLHLTHADTTKILAGSATKFECPNIATY